MSTFVQVHRDSIIGTLSGFDRLRLRGTMRLLAHVGGMMDYLRQMGVRLKEFAGYAQSVTQQVRQATEQVARAAGRPLLYLPSSSENKERRARLIAEEDHIQDGLICVLSSVEPCYSYDIYRNRETRQIELRRREVKCKHYYHYMIHPVLGFMHVRLQTWFPFTVHICINGREWLARLMDKAGIAYLRQDNCFLTISDPQQAQVLFDGQLRTQWPAMLDRLVRQINPAHPGVFRRCPVPYYWTVDESEWATDVMFRSARALKALYPRLLRHGMQVLGSVDVMRFLGRRVPTHRNIGHGGIHNAFKGEVITDLKARPEGVRIKHRVNANSVKMYDKQGSVLRVETTINHPRDMKVYRTKEGDPGGQKSWRYLRKTVVDLRRRAQVCQASNDRYLDAMAAAEASTPLSELAQPVCKPVTWKGKRARAINPLNHEDAALLEAVSRGEFSLNGFRNRDLRPLLYTAKTRPGPQEIRRQSAAITRKLRLLRAHRLIRKVPHTHRYVVSPTGRRVITALLLARQADTKTLIQAA